MKKELFIEAIEAIKKQYEFDKEITTNVAKNTTIVVSLLRQ